MPAPVRAAYNYAEHLPERRRTRQSCGDYLDGRKNGAEEVLLHGRSA